MTARAPIAACVLVAVSMWTGSAAAHTGETVYSGTSGSYLVIVTGDTVTQEGDEGILYTVALHDTMVEQPVVDASVTVSASADDGTEVGPVEARPQGNTYAVFVPDDGKTRWDVQVDITGEPGEAQVTHQMHGLAVGVGEADESGPAWVPWAIAGAVMALAAAVWLRARSRRTERVPR